MTITGVAQLQYTQMFTHTIGYFTYTLPMFAFAYACMPIHRRVLGPSEASDDVAAVVA